jgi:hypothetical protein
MENVKNGNGKVSVEDVEVAGCGTGGGRAVYMRVLAQVLLM